MYRGLRGEIQEEVIELNVSFQTVTPEYLLRNSPNVVSSYQQDDDDGVNSQKIFGPVSDYYCCKRPATRVVVDSQGVPHRYCSVCQQEVYPSSVREDVRSMIRLAVPIIHPILAGADGEYLGNILGFRAHEIPGLMKGICNCTICYDTETGKFLPINTVSNVSGERYLLQGEAILEYIKGFDFEEEISNEIMSRIKAKWFVPSAPDVEIGYACQDEGSYYISKGYSVFFEPGCEVYLKRAYSELPTPEEVREHMVKYLCNPLSRLSLLLNGSIESLEKMIVTAISVTPPGTRPAIENRQAMTTLLYNKVIQANNMLYLLTSADSLVSRAMHIQSLYNGIYNLLVEYRSNPPKPGRNSFAEMLGSKFGHPRAKQLGKRVDWSGRAVIVANPTLDLDECLLPFTMVKKIYAFHLKAARIDLGNDMVVRRVLEEDILQRIPVMINRAPTLHRLSVRAFYVRIWDEWAIGLHPLVCEGYNADFDGDAVAVHVPLNDAAVLETRELMITSNNIYIPASGAISIKPRQELIFGLYMLTRHTLQDVQPVTERPKYFDFIDVANAFKRQEVDIDDVVTCHGYVDTVGRQALRSCLPKDMQSDIGVITKKSIIGFMEKLTSRPAEEFKPYIAALLDLSYAAATLYSPSLKILDETPKSVKAGYKEFFARIAPLTKEFRAGFEPEDNYADRYSQIYNEIKDRSDKVLGDAIGRENGYVILVDSGARGDIGNLSQIFAAKGQVSRTAYQAFTSVLQSSYLDQLQPLEHFISAYGTRKTMIDKTQKTGDTGYAMKQMSHVTSQFIITCKDCGTGRGITLSRQYIAHLLPRDSSGKLQLNEAGKILEQFIFGRYEAGTNKFIDRKYAKEIIDGDKEVTIRSILTCDDPCCAKCYGLDTTYNRPAVVGHPIGYIAAQSIGEPGTQLTMRTFHGGGVTGKADVTSAFDQIQELINLVNRRDFDKHPNYDPIAWASGKVHIVDTGKSKRVSIGGNPKYIEVPEGANIKESVKRGEGLAAEQGDFDIREYLEINGLDKTQKYLAIALFLCYQNQATINFKHFEVLVAGMTRYICIDVEEGADICIGQSITIADYAHRDELYYTKGAKFHKTLLGTDDVPLRSRHMLEHLAFSHVREGLFLMSYLGTDDPLVQPYSRMLVGLSPRIGTYYTTYLGDRREELMKCPIL